MLYSAKDSQEAEVVFGRSLFFYYRIRRPNSSWQAKLWPSNQIEAKISVMSTLPVFGLAL
jgi:hypothetical protein